MLIVLAVNWPPHAPAPGQADASTAASSASSMRARGVGAHRLEHLLERDVAPAVPAGGDRAAVQDEPGDVEAAQRHRRGGDGLVAADDEHQAVERVAARHQLDGVGDHLA